MDFKRKPAGVKGGEIGLSYLIFSNYFIINMVTLLIYPFSRYYLGVQQTAYSLNEDFFLGSDREVQIMSLVGMSILFKLIKSNTWEEFIANFFMFSKLAFLILFMFNKPRFAILYFALCFILWLTMAQPKYKGPSKLITFSNAEQFYENILGYQQEELITGVAAQDYIKKKQKENKKLKGGHKPKEKSFDEMQTTLLIFSANWCDACVFTYSMWIKFANRFSTEKLKVVEVDAARYNNICQVFKVNYKDGNQLPTLLLLEDNREVLRFPPIDYDKGTMGRVLTYKEKDLVSYFDLDKRFLATRKFTSNSMENMD